MRLMRLTGLRDAYVELICTPRRAAHGLARPAALSEPVLRLRDPVPVDRDRGAARARLHLHVSSIPRIPPQSINPRVKNFHWGDMNRALFEAFEAGCELPVLVDYDGNIAEGPGFNVFAVRDGTVTTPEGTCLDGITRQTALICSQSRTSRS